MVNLRKGARFEDREGNVVTIVKKVELKPGQSQPFKGDNGLRYSVNGCYRKSGERDDRDLIREVGAHTGYGSTWAPAPKVAAAKPTPTVSYSSPSCQVAPAPAKKKDKPSMIDRIFGGSIGAVKDNNFKMTLQGPAVRTAQGKYVTRTAAGELMDVTELAIDAASEFLYKLPVQRPQVNDLIVIAEAPLDAAYVTAVREDGAIEVLNPKTSREEVYRKTTNIFGVNYFIKLTSLMDFTALAGGQNAGNPLAGILPLLLLTKGEGEGGLFGGSGEGGLKDLLPIMMLTGGLGGAPAQAGANPMAAMLPMLLLSGKGGLGGGSSDLVETMLLMQVFQGGGANPLGNLFGGAQATAQQAAQ